MAGGKCIFSRVAGVLLPLFLLLLLSDVAVAAENLKDAFLHGKVGGALRAYYNFRDFDTTTDTSTFAAGGNLHAETDPLYGVSAGATFYLSEDLGTRSTNRARRNPNLPEGVTVIGDAYLEYGGFGNALRVGRQKIDTPFANPSDAFMIPVTFEAVSFSNTTVPGLTIAAHYLENIKNRPSGEFVNVGRFATGRLGASRPADRGTGILGATYAASSSKVQAWGYFFPDLFQIVYLEADQTIGEAFGVKPKVAAQFVHESDNGDRLFGNVNANGFGLKLSGAHGPITLWFAWNHFVEDQDAFLRGGVLAPFNFATSALFTNSMVQTMENGAPGNAYKATVDAALAPDLVGRVSFTLYERDAPPDTNETDVDLTYSLRGGLEGLSFRVRLGIIDSGTGAARLFELRPQLQYVF